MRLIVTILAALAALSLAACQSADPAIVHAMDRFVNQTVGPEYEAYVEADPELGEIDKRVRLRNVETMRAAVEGMR